MHSIVGHLVCQKGPIFDLLDEPGEQKARYFVTSDYKRLKENFIAYKKNMLRLNYG